MRRVLALAGVVCALVATAAADDTTPSAEDMEKAREHYAKGKAHHDAGEYDQAAVEYEKSYELSRSPVLLYNLAQVERLGGHPEKALAHYKRYLELQPDGQGAQIAREFMEAITADLDQAKKTGAPPEVVEPDKDPDKAQPIEPDPIIIVLPPADPRDERSGGRGKIKRISGLVVGGVGLVSIGLGVKFGVDARSRADDVAQLSGMWDPADEDIWDDGEAAERKAIIFASVGGAAVVGGAVLYLLGSRDAKKPAESRVAATPAVGRDSVGLALTGHF